MRTLLTIAALLAAGGCVGGGYELVEPRPVAVTKAKFVVTPTRQWNRVPRTGDEIAEEENWTANGRNLDNIGFIGGLREGRAIVRQRRKRTEKVPVFRAGMSPQELVSMIESFYRIRAGATIFETTGVAPQAFLGAPGFRFDYDYTGFDEVRRRGRSVGAVIDGRFYLLTLDGTRLHYFDAALPEFETLAATARLRG